MKKPDWWSYHGEAVRSGAFGFVLTAGFMVLEILFC